MRAASQAGADAVQRLNKGHPKGWRFSAGRLNVENSHTAICGIHRIAGILAVL